MHRDSGTQQSERAYADDAANVAAGVSGRAGNSMSPFPIHCGVLRAECRFVVAGDFTHE